MSLSDTIMYQAMFEHVAMLTTLTSEVRSLSKGISSKEEQYQQMPRHFLSSKLQGLLELFLNISKKEAVIETNYFILLIRLFLKAMIDNTKTVNTMLPAMESEKKDEQLS